LYLKLVAIYLVGAALVNCTEPESEWPHRGLGLEWEGDSLSIVPKSDVRRRPPLITAATDLRYRVLVESGAFAGSAKFVRAPRDIIVVGENVLVVGGGEYQLAVFNRHTGFPGQRGLERRREKAGLVSYTSVVPDPTRISHAWVFDIYRRRLLEINIADPPASADGASYIQLKVRGVIQTPQFVRGGDIVAAGYLYRGLLTRFDQTGQPTAVIGQPAYDTAGTPSDVRAHVNYGRLVKRPKLDILALGYIDLPRVDILCSDGQLLHAIEFPVGIWPKPAWSRDATGDTMYVADNETRVGIVDVAATGEALYVLLSARKIGNDGDAASFSDDVWQLDWAGNVVRRFRLRGDAVALAVSETNDKMYVLEAPAPAVVAYDIGN